MNKYIKLSLMCLWGGVVCVLVSTLIHVWILCDTLKNNESPPIDISIVAHNAELATKLLKIERSEKESIYQTLLMQLDKDVKLLSFLLCVLLITALILLISKYRRPTKAYR